MNIAIIGAGLAGLCAAQDLIDAGHAVSVFDKGRGPGGRCATRRSPVGAFDHGAPMLHNLPPDLKAQYSDLLMHHGDGCLPVPSVNALPKALAVNVQPRLSHKLTSLSRSNGAWTLALEGEDTLEVRADVVLLCLPAPQLPALLPPNHFPEIATVRMAPEWTLMCGFEAMTDLLDKLVLEGGHSATCQNTLPGRAPGGDRWVIRAGGAWSAQNVEAERDDVTAQLLAAFQAKAGLGEPIHIALHRWLYARTAQPLGQPCLWDGAQRIGCAGDWCIGADAGDAVASGRALAAAVLKDI